jgi:uncharacterized membrane protein
MAHLHVMSGAGEQPAHPVIRKIAVADLKDALVRGFDDFWAMPSHTIFLGLIYPLAGIFLGALTLGYDVLPMLYPLAAGFALIGPFAAIGLYELSRRREAGLEASWRNVFDVRRSPSIDAIAVLGVLLMLLFLAWLYTAKLIYQSIFGVLAPEAILPFLQKVLTTADGWWLILIGNGVGFLYAVVALSISVVSFPLLLDRDVGVAVAVLTSIRAVLANPLTMALWGLIVAALLVIGFLPFFVGLAIVVPVLGHATWHLYRKVVVPEP